ncbi:UNVERIFIED_CONTAM: EARP-interacting protein [Gekko kuhli]
MASRYIHMWLLCNLCISPEREICTSPVSEAAEIDYKLRNYVACHSLENELSRKVTVCIKDQIYCIESAHGQLVRDLDFNPNKQYYLASCGDDCKVKFWDTRNVSEPVKTLEEHSHWVWNVRYNHSHDQLVLTASSDSRVILSNMVSISSEPFGHLVDDEELSDQEDHQQEDK